MRSPIVFVSVLLALSMAACSDIQIQPSDSEQFGQANYQYYKWRSPALPAAAEGAKSADPIDSISSSIRKAVDAGLQDKGYQLNEERAQFSVDYFFRAGILDGVASDQASNIVPFTPTAINRQSDQASVDNAIALGGVKATRNVVLQFNDVLSSKEVWKVTMTEIVANANQENLAQLEDSLKKSIPRALSSLPEATH